MFEELKNKVEALLGHTQEIQAAVEAAATAPNIEKAIVEALIAALEAQGYTVTPPAQG